MRPHFFQLFRQLDIIGQTELIASIIEDVSGVAQGGFADAVGLLNRLHGRFEIGQVIETVKHPENIHSGICSMSHESIDHVIRVVGVADGVTATKKHLETDVWNLFAQDPEAFPGVLTKEAHGSIKGGASPHFHGKQSLLRVSQMTRHEIRAPQHVMSAHTSGHERLVGIAESGVGDQEAFLFQYPL